MGSLTLQAAALILNAKQPAPTEGGLSFEDAATLAVALLGLCVAVAAWITSRRAAREAKRSADIAEQALAVETERRAEERTDRALEEAPRWKPVHNHLRLEGESGPFLVGLENAGPDAIVESATLEADGEVLQGVPIQKKPIPTGNQMFVEFALQGAVSMGDCEQVTAVITARAVHNGQRSRYRLTLLPRSPIVNGVPTWRAGRDRVEPLD